MTDILAKITRYKLEEIRVAKESRPLAEVEAAARSAAPVRPFAGAIEATLAAGRFALIAEIKKASPSKGLIRADFAIVEFARVYEAGVATCLSVLTATPSIQGVQPYVTEGGAVSLLPSLRKDSLCGPY